MVKTSPRYSTLKAVVFLLFTNGTSRENLVRLVTSTSVKAERTYEVLLLWEFIIPD